MKALNNAHSINNFMGFLPFREQNHPTTTLKSWYIDDWLKCHIQDFYIENLFKTKFQTEFIFEQKTKTITSKFDLKLQKFTQAKAKFNQLLPELLKKHKGKYVAIIGENIEIGEDKDFLFEAVNKKYGSQTMYLSKITEQKKAVRLRSPKLAKK